ncbi:MFS transporter [Amycolatopsis jejuensis]|uniref:MFS transporter n=1 Tax=Amycolatopsis jejuensis TaxID=330084 RepID=UPI000526A4F3|nr:MFS transporter [Amycolatopsis jejuensis]
MDEALAPRRGRALAVLSAAQLITALDGMMMVIALPSAQRDIGLSASATRWVLVAYSLTLGAFLLAGGRAGDVIGRRRALVIGVLGFAVSSMVSGSAVAPGMLIAGRVAQGLFAALLAPAALSLVTTTFTERAERAKALAVFSSTLMAGVAAGQVLGGVLTSGLGWRWCLFVSVPIALTVAVLTPRCVAPVKPDRGVRLDVPGVVLASSGLASLVYALAEAGRDGWGAATTIGPLAASAVLLAVFAFWQTRVRQPLLPLGILASPARVGANLAVVSSQFAMFGMFLFLTYQLQLVNGWPAWQTGLAFLPFVAVNILAATQVVPRSLGRIGPRVVIPAGLVLIGAGFVVFTRLGAGSTYPGLVLPVLVLLGVGGGLLMPSSVGTAATVDDRTHTAPASALVRTSQQVGAALGPAVLGTLAAARTSVTASAWGAVIVFTSALVVAVLLRRA